MDKIKTVKIKNEDGSISEESYTISVDARNVDMDNGKELQETIGTIDIDTDGNIAEQLENLNIDIKKKAYFFDTVIDMKNANLKVGDYACTLGYYEVNDEGAGKYQIISGNYIDDGGNYHKLKNNLYAKLIITDKINIKQFGVYGDGIHDDTEAIQNAVNSSAQIILLNKNGNYFVGKENSVDAIYINNKIIIGNKNQQNIFKSNKEFYIYCKQVSISNVTFEGPTLGIRGENTIIDNFYSYHSYKKGIYLMARSDMLLKNIIIKNCYLEDTLQYGYEIGSSIIDSAISLTADNILFENCIAKSCGRVKTLNVPNSGSTWSPGFCIENPNNNFTVTNITFKNCIAEDSLESGFHIEDGVTIKNVTYICCYAKDNGLRKYYHSEFYDTSGNAVYTGEDALIFGAGFLTRDTAQYISCTSEGNYRDIYPCGYRIGNLIIPHRYFDTLDIYNDSEFNYRNLHKPIASGILFDSNVNFQYDFPYSNENAPNLSYVRSEFIEKTKFNTNQGGKPYLASLNNNTKSINFATTYNNNAVTVISFYPIPVNMNKKYELSFKILAQNNSSSLATSNVTTQLGIGIFDKNLQKLSNNGTQYMVWNRYINPNSTSTPKEYIITLNDRDNNTNVFFDNTAYLVFAFRIDEVSTVSGHDVKYDYLAPIISDIVLKEI